jgi:hypothetical protein
MVEGCRACLPPDQGTLTGPPVDLTTVHHIMLQLGLLLPFGLPGVQKPTTGAHNAGGPQQGGAAWAAQMRPEQALVGNAHQGNGVAGTTLAGC